VATGGHDMARKLAKSIKRLEQLALLASVEGSEIRPKRMSLSEASS